MRVTDEGIVITTDMLENILELALAGYWVWYIDPTVDPKEQKEYLSPTWKAMLGYADHELENKAGTWMQHIFKEDLPTAIDAYQAHVDSKGKIPYNLEVRYRHKNGHTVYIICVGHIVEWNEDGTPAVMVGCHIDITDNKKLELFSRSEQLLQNFSANITRLKEINDG